MLRVIVFSLVFQHHLKRQTGLEDHFGFYTFQLCDTYIHLSQLCLSNAGRLQNQCFYLKVKFKPTSWLLTGRWTLIINSCKIFITAFMFSLRYLRPFSQDILDQARSVESMPLYPLETDWSMYLIQLCRQMYLGNQILRNHSKLIPLKRSR